MNDMQIVISPLKTAISIIHVPKIQIRYYGNPGMRPAVDLLLFELEIRWYQSSNFLTRYFVNDQGKMAQIGI